MDKKKNGLMFMTVLCFFLQISGNQSLASDGNDLSGGCDKAPHFFWKGRLGSDEDQAQQYYQEAIDLCPGYIRPYELVGNSYRKENQQHKAMLYFTKAAELGTTNHKLYYLLASLLFQKGDLDEADRNIKKSLGIRGDYPRALKLKQEIEKAADKEGPRIILYEPSTRRGMQLVKTYENLTVRGIATDKSGVAWVKVNQLETSLDEHGNFLKDIPIRLGTNTLRVEAADSLGNRAHVSIDIEGEKYVLPPLTRVESTSQRKALYGKSFAVVIGINNYEKWPGLEFAIADAHAVKASLEKSGFDEIIMILNKEATQRRILTELFDRLPKMVDRNDRVLFYFAGHGQTEDLRGGGKKGYIIPADAETDSYASTAVSMEQIRSLSSRIAAKHIFYVMDCCYSGLGLNRSAGVWPGISDYLRKVSAMRVVQIITAGGQGEQVQEREGHGLFTTYFLKAIAGEADLDKDNVVTGTELGAYLRPTVSNASRQAQTPLFGRLAGDGEFLFFVKKEK
ncbi:MAG: caspase family protein [Desulfobacterales bacterium]|nr:caspase family protein [Desulfobacterales bacterium]